MINLKNGFKKIVILTLIGFFISQSVRFSPLPTYAEDASASSHSEVVVNITPTPSQSPTPSLSLTPTHETSAQPTSSLTPSPTLSLTPTQSPIPTTEITTTTQSSITSTPSTPSATPTPTITPAATDSANTATGSGSTNMTTGDATASSNVLSIGGGTSTNSTIGVTTNEITGGNQGDVVLPSLTPPSAGSGSAVITGDNIATNTAIASASANTGTNNQASGGNANMTTGNAFATANAITITNANLVNSLLQLGVLNVYQTWNGNLILAPVDPATGSGSTADIQNSNQTYVVTEAGTLSNTGGNTQSSSGSANMTTGNAASISTTKSISNVNLYNAYIFQMLFTNPSLWTGTVYNFLYPGSVQTVPEFLAYLSTHSEYQNLTGTPNSNLQVNNNNFANVVTAAYASANTGSNTQSSSGSANMTTGNAFSAATALSLTNINLVNSVFRWELINLFQPWTGNLIFAYPELVISVQAPDHVYEGEQIPYQVTVTNIGYAPASGISSDEQVTQDSNHKTLAAQTTQFPNLLPGESSTQTMDFGTGGLGTQTLDFHAHVNSGGTAIPSSSDDTSMSTNILPQGAVSEATNTPAPHLSLTVSNNVNGYVYAGDHVRYKVDITNTDSVTADNVVFIQTLNDFNHQTQSQFQIPLGSLQPGKSKHLNYELALDSKLKAGEYYTNSQAISITNNNEADSDVVTNLIPVKDRNNSPIITALVPPVQAASGTELLTPQHGSVLGSSITSTVNYYLWAIMILTVLAAIYLLSKRAKARLLSTTLGIIFLIAAIGTGLASGGKSVTAYYSNTPLVTARSQTSTNKLLAQIEPTVTPTPTPTPSKLAFTGGEAHKSSLLPGATNNLIVESLGLNIPITKAEFNNNEWVVREDSISMYKSDQTIVIYGHDWPQLLGFLPKLKDGNTIKITQDKIETTYKVTQTFEVTPDNTSALSTNHTDSLMIYTCTGKNDTKRLVLQAEKI